MARQRVVLPLPPKAVGGNEANQPVLYHLARTRYGQDCYFAIVAAKLSAVTKCYLHWEFNLAARYGLVQNKRGGRSKVRMPDDLYRPMDKSNALRSVKAAEDALVRAKVIPDDSHKYVIGHEVTLNHSPSTHRGQSNVVLTIEEVKDA